VLLVKQFFIGTASAVLPDQNLRLFVGFRAGKMFDQCPPMDLHQIEKLEWDLHQIEKLE